MTSVRVFVYGTLKRGQPNHWYLDETSDRAKKGISKFMGKAQTLDKYPLVVATRLNVPFLLSARGVGKNIIGEVYEVNDECFQALDELEEYPKLYGRELINVRLLEHDGNGASCDDAIQCWCYFLYNFRPNLLKLPYYEEYDDSKRPEDARYDEKSAPDDSDWKEHVRGEVYEMDTDILAMVDDLEHHPDLYERHQVDVKFDEDSRANSVSDDVISCWCYFLVKYKPYLFNLPLFENYDCNIGDKAEQYVRPSDRPADEKFSHWHEVHTDY